MWCYKFKWNLVKHVVLFLIAAKLSTALAVHLCDLRSESSIFLVFFPIRQETEARN